MFFEAGVMIHSGFCASNEPKFELARYLGECRDNEENLRSMFSEILAGTAVKASETGARRPVDVCFARTGVERRRSSPMSQAAFYGDWGRTRFGEPRFCADRNGVETSPTSRKSLSCHESSACRRLATYEKSAFFVYS